MVKKLVLIVIAGSSALFATTTYAADYSKIRQEVRDSLLIQTTEHNKAEREIREEYAVANNAFIDGKNDIAMEFFATDVHVFDAMGGGEETFQSMASKNQGLIDIIETISHVAFRDMKIKMLGPNAAYARYFQEFAFTLKDGRPVDFIGRGTDLWLKRNGKWQVIDEHYSVPVDFKTGQANWLSKPASGYK